MLANLYEVVFFRVQKLTQPSPKGVTFQGKANQMKMKRKSINRVNARDRGFVHENASLKWIHVNALDFFDNSITYYSSFIHDQH